MKFSKFSSKKKRNFYGILFTFVSGLIFFGFKNQSSLSFLIPLIFFGFAGLTLVYIMPNSFWEGKLMEEIDKKNFKGYQIVLVTLSIVAIAVALFYTFLTYQIKQTEIEQKKPIYWHTEDVLNGIVAKTERITRGHGIGVILEDGTVKNIGWAENGLYKPKNELWDFIQIGDSLSKTAGNDSLKILRGGTDYYFIISKRINIDYK
jgi:hypothetical protein